jgi:glycosyltransferase involved in cell wall biosynthesis
MAVKLSVIIPVYNTAEYLEVCINSVLNQSFRDIEVILIDNHSTDGSAEILRDYTNKDGRVRYYQTPQFGKASVTRQFGLQFASGEFITYVDSDDSVKPGMYERLFAEQSKSDADVVVCNYDVVYPEHSEKSYSAMRNEVIDIEASGYPQYFKEYFCMPHPNNYLWSRIMRRSIITEHEISFPPVDISEDTIFTMFCSAFSRKIAHISDSYYNYNQRENSTMRETIRKKKIAESYVFAFSCVEKYVKAHGLADVFAEIFPVYAATRIRSVLFYSKLVGKDEQTAFAELIPALKTSNITKYLRELASNNEELNAQAQKTLRLLDGVEKL